MDLFVASMGRHKEVVEMFTKYCNSISMDASLDDGYKSPSNILISHDHC